MTLAALLVAVSIIVLLARSNIKMRRELSNLRPVRDERDYLESLIVPAYEIGRNTARTYSALVIAHMIGSPEDVSYSKLNNIIKTLEKTARSALVELNTLRRDNHDDSEPFVALKLSDVWSPPKPVIVSEPPAHNEEPDLPEEEPYIPERDYGQMDMFA